MLVTGGTKGIGLATARRFAAAGHPLVLTYRRDAEAAAAAKSALETLTRYYATELAGRGIRVNCVLPGPVDTESARIWASDAYERFVARASQATPAGRLATPDDIAGVVVALCGPDMAWVTGQVLVADGGMFFNDRIFADE